MFFSIDTLRHSPSLSLSFFSFELCHFFSQTLFFLFCLVFIYSYFFCLYLHSLFFPPFLPFICFLITFFQQHCHSRLTFVHHSRTSDKFELILVVRTLSWKTPVSPYTINGNGLFIFPRQHFPFLPCPSSALFAFHPASLSHLLSRRRQRRYYITRIMNIAAKLFATFVSNSSQQVRPSKNRSSRLTIPSLPFSIVVTLTKFRRSLVMHTSFKV